MIVLIALLLPAQAEPIYTGEWVEYVRDGDGAITARVAKLGGAKRRARFVGEWLGSPFSYTVDFAGPDDSLVGEAIIGGTAYRWRGKISDTSFEGRFTSTATLRGRPIRRGYFRMRRTR